MAKFEKHIFICTNQRDASSPRGCCNPGGQGELHKQFKEKLKARGLQPRFRANKAGCLDQCEHGPNIVVYPEAVWYGGVKAEDIDEIIDSHLLGGKPVARLTLREECMNTESCEHKGKRST
jgi:(2Fe-2S) ferredoxin